MTNVKCTICKGSNTVHFEDNQYNCIDCVETFEQEGELIVGSFALMGEPIDYQISVRLNQIVAYFGKTVFDHLILNKKMNNFCDVHINNLYATYGRKKVLKVYEECYLQLDKAI